MELNADHRDKTDPAINSSVVHFSSRSLSHLYRLFTTMIFQVIKLFFVES